jgi:putative MFS transporter
MASQGEELVALYDEAPLDSRYWVRIGLLIVTSVFDYFDYFVVGFLVSILGPAWHLTFGQTSLMLLAAGVGAIVGALTWGALADRWGRKNLAVAGITLCALGAGAVSILPDGAWQLFTALRFVVGFGVGAAAAVGVPLIVEFTPTRHRTVLTSAATIPVSLGVLVASLTTATMLEHIGWRGLAALGLAPLVPAVLIAILMPESVRWLVTHGKLEEARAVVARTLRRAPDSLPRPAERSLGATNQQAARVGFTELLAEPRRFWLTVIVWIGASTANYGVFLWGPTIVALLMGVPTKDAAHFFIIVSLVGMAGRVAFSLAPRWIGRRRCGEIMGYGLAVTLAAAGLFYDRVLFGYPAFVVLLIPASLFYDGGFANIAPYSAEIFPVRLSGRGVGLAQAANGIGKIAGPLCLALIAGTSNLVTPKATAAAIMPAFLFLAACGLAIGIAFSLLGVETHGKPLALSEGAGQSTA